LLVRPVARQARGVIHQHPLAYLAGLEGVALLRAYAGEHDAAFVERRLARLRELLADPSSELTGEPADLEPLSPAEAYDGWAPSYDEPNSLIEDEEPVLLRILDSIPPGFAVDAATGTGRVAEHLVARGHRVLGLDVSPGMLAAAGARVPGAAFGYADLRRLPLPDGVADLVTCSLALSHLPTLDGALGELARVLRPGGDLVVTDSRGMFPGSRCYPLVMRAGDGRWGYLPNHHHRTVDYLTAALPWCEVVTVHEVPREAWAPEDFDEPVPPDPSRPPDFWALMDLDPEAACATYADTAGLVVWHLRRRA
jgi:SAM-dependent methyltransferase